MAASTTSPPASFLGATAPRAFGSFADAAGEMPAGDRGVVRSPPDLMMATTAAGAAGGSISASSSLFVTAAEGWEEGGELYEELHESIGRLQTRILQKLGRSGGQGQPGAFADAAGGGGEGEEEGFEAALENEA